MFLPMLCVADYYVHMCQNFCCTQMVSINVTLSGGVHIINMSGKVQGLEKQNVKFLLLTCQGKLKD
jgi:hypothetical protein